MKNLKVFIVTYKRSDILEQTQDLPEYYCENSYLYAFKPEVLDQNNRIGKNPYLLEIGFPYNLDIDTEQDWDMINRIGEY
jgi:CMP-N-acetylneuraminic acid synthetase|tara:strand:- start:150 stop:389 length:240 start_codon:yes stop_codon:yes gene_type:complete